MSRKEANGVTGLRASDNGLGLGAGEVVLVEHDQRWADLFSALAGDLRASLSTGRTEPFRFDVQHVGSTAVRGLAAKPVLDVAVGLEATIDVDDVVERLSDLGLEYRGDLGIFGGLLFVVSQPSATVSAHVHVVDIDDFQWRWYLGFRDALRADPSLAAAYEREKRAAAKAHPNDRPGYTEAKSDWVLAAVQRTDP